MGWVSRSDLWLYVAEAPGVTRQQTRASLEADMTASLEHTGEAPGSGAPNERPRTQAESSSPAGRARTPRRAVTGRQRRTLARWLRRTACHFRYDDPVCGGTRQVLNERVRAVREDLLELADLLEQIEHPDLEAMAELRMVLSDGGSSPLLNADLHLSELKTSLFYIRIGLLRSVGEH
jgi:hypothetical protein